MSLPALTLLIGLQLVGSLFSQLWMPHIPGSVVGLLMLVSGLLFLGRVPDGLSRTAGNLLSYLPLMLVVPAAGILDTESLLWADWLSLAAALVLSLMLTLPLCGWLLQRLVRRQGRVE